MSRISDAVWLVGLSATLLLGGCSSSEHGTDFPAVTSAGACTGNLRAFGESSSQPVSLTCSGIPRSYVAYPESIAHRYSRCTYTFETAATTGNGTMACSNGKSGPLTYDMSDPTNIKVT